MLRRFVPKPIRRVIGKVRGSIRDSMLDTYDILFRRRSDMTPPRRLQRMVGEGNFEKIGQEFLQYFVQLGGLRRQHKVLEVGCGVGRMAAPLTKYLEPPAIYEGLDLVPEEIEWCRKKITSRFPNFHFRVADVLNKVHNPNGKHTASEYRFPYPDEFFDFAILTSVFTHMLFASVENYLSEMSRVMKSQGNCLVTYFLLTPESKSLIRGGQSTLPFDDWIDGFFTVDKSQPEKAIAIEEEIVRKMYETHGFSIIEPIFYGSWVKRQDSLSYQDIVVATRAKRQTPSILRS